MAHSNTSHLTRLLSRARNAFRYILRLDFSGLIKRIHHIYHERKDSVVKCASWCIICTPHTLFVAHLIRERLEYHGWSVDIVHEVPASFDHEMYIVISAQMFNPLPPGERCIIYQMEQSVTSRWFTDDYLKKLENCRAVLEYSLSNLPFLSEKGLRYPHIYYLPVGASLSFFSGKRQKKFDVLFYGDAKSSPRRRYLLDELSKHFNVHICSEIYGREMHGLISSAKLVINLHYYDDAFLEMPRIQECLSLGVPVLSESSKDQTNYPFITDAVHFFEAGNVTAMIEAVHSFLALGDCSDCTVKSVYKSFEHWCFMFDRFLVADGFLPAEYALELIPPIDCSSSSIVLSLPETFERRQKFFLNNHSNYQFFDGLRMKRSWLGAGLSYAVLARSALNDRISRLTIMEDDVLLSGDHAVKISLVHEFLDKNSDAWDVFSGLIALVHPDVKILDVVEYKGMHFVIINKIMSMVFNIYNESALQILSLWDPRLRCDQTNTIDRYLESLDDLRVVVALPFLVGHREDVDSTLWGIANTQYADLIAEAESILIRKAEEFLLTSQRADPS